MVSVTKLIDILNKPALLYWANKIGLDGISLKDFYKKSASEGTDKHKQIENYLLNKIEFPESEKLLNCLKGYDIISVEHNVNNGFITGRIDLVIRDKSNKIVVDFKSNTKMYLNQKLQLSTYKELSGCNKIAIINFTSWKLEFIDIDTKYYFEILKRLYQIHELLTKLGERL